MKSWITRSMLVALLLPLPGTAFAQANVGFSVAGIMSLQPVNEEWVGSPYLDEGIGGTQPGVAAGIDVVLENGFTVIGEISTTRTFEQFQRGRLIWANRSALSNEGSGTTRLRDTLFSGLAGYSTSNRSTRIVVLGGISGVRTTLTEDDLVVDEQSEFGLEGRRHFALTGGVDFLQRLSSRASLLIGARYSRLGRSENADQTGAGEQLIRIGVGVRVGLGR
jgi:hypothetical protein